LARTTSTTADGHARPPRYQQGPKCSSLTTRKLFKALSNSGETADRNLSRFIDPIAHGACALCSTQLRWAWIRVRASWRPVDSGSVAFGEENPVDVTRQDSFRSREDAQILYYFGRVRGAAIAGSQENRFCGPATCSAFTSSAATPRIVEYSHDENPRSNPTGRLGQ